MTDQTFGRILQRDVADGSEVLDDLARLGVHFAEFLLRLLPVERDEQPSVGTPGRSERSGFESQFGARGQLAGHHVAGIQLNQSFRVVVDRIYVACIVGGHGVAAMRSQIAARRYVAMGKIMFGESPRDAAVSV